MTQSTLTLLIVITGTATVLLSLYVAGSFWYRHRSMDGDGKRLANALHLQLAGEAVIGFGTLVFATLAWKGLLPGIPIEVQSVMRLAMFLATSLTTLHLFMVVSKLHDTK